MNKERMYQEFMDLVTTDSASGKEEAIAQKLMPKLEELGFTVSRDNAGELFGGECGNVIGIREGELDGAILLSSHMDRVPNGFGIKPVEKDGIVYSDGTTILAADDLSGVVAILEGVRGAIAAGKPLPRIEIVFSVGEEANLWGAKGMDVSMLKSRIGYMVDSPGRTGRVINGAPGRYDLDVEIFGRHIAPALGISRRYVGTEPLSPLTNSYNRALAALLPACGVEVVEVPRLEEGGQPISASRVRALLATGELNAIAPLVPPTTFDYLKNHHQEV